MAMMVNTSIREAIASLVNSDLMKARNVIDGDKVINSFEIDIDNSTFNTLTLSAANMPPEMLRRILAIQKINPILERIGDHAVNIAESTISLSDLEEKYSLFEIPEMAKLCCNVFADAASGFFNDDLSSSTEILLRDDSIDDMARSITTDVKNALMTLPESISFSAGIEIVGVARNLERIADLAMNIAEETIYMIEGNIVKHQPFDRMPC
jgi:phosphate transport system protein